jgi:hypothetical protein
MILTDVFPDQRNYHQHLDERPATCQEMKRLGSVLRDVHLTTRGVRTQIRSQGDVWFRDHTFDFCLRAARHPVLDHACEELAIRDDQQLILGDLAPKNLSLAAESVAICDLDNVHHGWPGYDVAYVLAHLLLHHLHRPDRLPALVAALLDAYGADQPSQRSAADDTLTAKIAAGVVLYRLTSNLVPYPLAVPTTLTGRFRNLVLALLDTGPLTTQDLLRTASEAHA